MLRACVTRQGRLRYHGAGGSPVPEEALTVAEVDFAGAAGERYELVDGYGGCGGEEVFADDGAAFWGQGSGGDQYVEFGGSGEV